MSGGTFSITHRFLVPGDADIRALVRSQARNVAKADFAVEIEQKGLDELITWLESNYNPSSTAKTAELEVPAYVHDHQHLGTRTGCR